MPQVIEEKHNPLGRWIAVACVVLVLAIVSGLLLYLAARDHAQKLKDEYNSASTQATDLVSRNQGADAVRLVQQYLSNKPPAPYKGQGEELLGMSFLADSKYMDALKAYQAAESDGQRDQFTNVESIAESARLAGDRQTALTYYKKELAALQARKTGVNTFDIEAVQTQISTLEASK